MPKNQNRLSVDKINAGNFTVPKGEEHLYHVKIEVPQYDSATGVKISTPRIQVFNAKMYPSLVGNLKQIGYKLEVLHDPTEFLKSKKNEKKLSKEDRMRERIIADLRAQGILKDPNEKSEEQLRAEIIEELKAKGMIAEPAKETPKAKSGKAKTEEAEDSSVEESLD
jgi:hypothetical protein